MNIAGQIIQTPKLVRNILGGGLVWPSFLTLFLKKKTAYHDRHLISVVKHSGEEMMIWVGFSSTKPG